MGISINYDKNQIDFICSIISCGFSLRGLSLVMMRVLAYLLAISPIIGRLLASLSPPAPITAMILRGKSALSTFSTPSGVWAKSTIVSGFLATNSVRPGTPGNCAIACIMSSWRFGASKKAPLNAHKILYRLNALITRFLVKCNYNSIQFKLYFQEL